MLPSPVVRAAAVVCCLAFPVRADEEDLNTQLLRATVKISHDSSTATGFVLAPAGGEGLILVTAAHVLETTAGDETALLYRSRDPQGEFRKESMPLRIRKEGQSLWTRHPAEDVAVLRINLPPGADFPRLPVELLATAQSLKEHAVHPGEHVALIGYPHRVEANAAGFAVLRAGAIASFPLVPSSRFPTFMVSANSFEGDSGGAVLLSRPGRSPERGEETRLILGLVSGQHFVDEDMKGLYGSSKTRHRLGLAVVVHAALIAETIALLPPQ